MNTRLVVVLLSSISFLSFSQTASFVAASQSSQSTSIIIDWSIGELITESFSNGSVHLSHGVNEAGSIFIITGDLKEPIAVEAKIYPVPFHSDVFIEAGDESSNLREQHITLLDETGRVMKAEVDFISNQKARVDGQLLAPGFYLLTLRTNNSIKTYKLLKK